MIAIATAPAKTILTGEHFVVYGEPAVAMAIDLRAQVAVKDRSDRSIHISSNLGISGTFLSGDKYRAEKGGMAARTILEPAKIASQMALKYLGEERGLNIEVDSNIPIASGLGSSGALTVATVAAVGKLLGADLTKEEIASLPFEAEKYVHFKPSGIDQTIATYGGAIMYRKGKHITQLRVKDEVPIVIGNTGIPRVTGDIVAIVQEKKANFPEVMDLLIQAAGRLSILSAKALEDGNLEILGRLMDINHGMLTAIGVSNAILDKLVYVARESGALGAKLTGAGGGGCIIALSTQENRNNISRAIQDAGGIPLITKKTERGVQAWMN